MSEPQQPVTREDLDRAVDRLSAQFGQRLDAMTAAIRANQDAVIALRTSQEAAVVALRSSQEAAVDAIRARQEAAVFALTANLSELREELRRRLERMETNLTAIQFQTAGMSKSLTDAERLDGRMLDTQHAQQRAIDDLAARVAKIERQLNPPDRQ